MADDELLDYEEQDEQEDTVPTNGAVGVAAIKKDVKGTYVSIHSSGFRDFLLKPELLRAIVDCGFEHPSEGKKNILKPSCRLLENRKLYMCLAAYRPVVCQVVIKH